MNQLQIDTLKEMVMGRNYYAVPEMYYEFFDELTFLGFCERQIISGKHIYKKIKDNPSTP